MDADSGQVRHLIETFVVTIASMTIELEFSDITTGIGRADIAHITEPSRTLDISIRHLADLTILRDDIQRKGIHEILAVGSFEDTQQDTLLTDIAITRRPTHTGDDIRLAQVETRPGVTALPRGKEGVQITVEGVLSRINGSGLGIITIVDVFCGTNDRTLQQSIAINGCQQ